MITAVAISFAGSFQWRGAMDPDIPGMPANTPDTPDARRKGGSQTIYTYKWNDTADFDKLIRLGVAVSLRDGLVDPWAPPKVTDIKVDSGAGLSSVSAPPLNGALIRGSGLFGQKIPGIHFTMGGFALELISGTRESYLGAKQGEGNFVAVEVIANAESAENEYLQKKPVAVQNAGKIDPARKKYLLETGGGKTTSSGFTVTNYVNEAADWFSYRGQVNDVPMTAYTGTLAAGLTGLARDIALFTAGKKWTMTCVMDRYDIDTLTGKCKGTLLGKNS